MSPGKNRMLSVTIRAARTDDTEAISALCTQLGYPSSPEQVQERLGTILADADHIVLVAQRATGQVIGWVQIHVRKLIVVDRHAEIVGLVVARTHRGWNVGRRLLEAAEAWALDQGCRAVHLRSNVQRTEAHRFYEKLGYHLTKTQRAYIKTL